LGLCGGIALAVLSRSGVALPMSAAAVLTLGVAWTMACWWVSESLPIAATSLLPLAVFPLAGVLSPAVAAAGYAHRFIVLLGAGFMVALTLEAHGLHRRLALGIMKRIGTSPARVMVSFMAATAGLSMWISNTATTLMMLPIAMAVLGHSTDSGEESEVDSESPNGRYTIALLLGVAFASNIGGIATPIGTPPNLIMVGVYAEVTGKTVNFAQWLAWGLPFVLLFVPITGWWLYHSAKLPADFALADPSQLERMQRELPVMSRAERRVLVIFSLTALAWITRAGVDFGSWGSLAGWQAWFPKGTEVDDSTVAVISALVMFCVPVGDGTEARLLEWRVAKHIPWGLLLLFGGGISLARGFEASGLSAAIGHGLSGFTSLPLVWLVLLIALCVTFLTEVTSNTATTTLLMPILAAASVAAAIDPKLLMVPAAMSASCAFMLPVATAPNAIVFGSGRVPILAMVRRGFVLNLIGAVLVTAVIMAVR